LNVIQDKYIKRRSRKKKYMRKKKVRTNGRGKTHSSSGNISLTMTSYSISALNLIGSAVRFLSSLKTH
jgi:hypothetical protein